MTMLASSLSVITTAFMHANHPLSLVIVLISLTIWILITLMSVTNASWISMILFLVFLGGLLIIFSYLSALVPNEIYFFNAGWLLILLNPIFTNTFMETYYIQSQKANLTEMINLNETSSIFFFLIYLLTTLAVTMVMAQQLKSPLNQNNY